MLKNYSLSCQKESGDSNLARVVRTGLFEILLKGAFSKRGIPLE